MGNAATNAAQALAAGEKSRSRSRTWSPSPQTLKRAAGIAQQAAQSARVRGVPAHLAHAYGEEAKEKVVAQAKQQALLKKKREAALAAAASGQAHTSLYDRLNGRVAAAPAQPRRVPGADGEPSKPRTLADVEVGDEVEAS